MIVEELNSIDLEWCSKLFDKIFDGVDISSFFINSSYKIIGVREVALAIFQLVEGEAEIIFIGVKKEDREKGHATNILNFFIDKYKPYVIFLDVRENNCAAISFYKENDFSIIGKRKNYYDGKMDALLMERWLWLT